MTDAVKIYHNPRCSKSRDTLSLLKANGIDPQVVLYLETPPDADTLRAVANAGDDQRAGTDAPERRSV
jgi:arsenate reductase